MTCTIEIPEYTWLAAQCSGANPDELAELLAQIPGFVGILKGPRHTHEFVNDAYGEVTGKRDLVGLQVREAFPELNVQPFFELLDLVYRTGERYIAHAVPIRFGDQSTNQFIDLLYEPIRNEAGAVTGIFVGGYDVTAQQSNLSPGQLNAAALRELRIWKLTPDLMGVLDSQGHFETSNPAWMTVLGWTEKEMRQMTFRDLVHPQDVEHTHRDFNLTLTGRALIRSLNRCRHRSGTYRWISWVGVLDEGQLYCTGRDITELKTAAIG